MPAATARTTKPADPVRLDSIIGPLVDGDAAAGMGRDMERLNQSFVESAIVSVPDAGAYQSAGHFLKELQAKRKTVVEFFSPMKTMAHKLHKAICTRENELLGPLDTIDRKVRNEMLRFSQEQERQRRIEEARLAEEARKEEEQRLLNEAALLERQGHHELAESVVEQATTMQAPVVTLASQTPSVAGVSMGSHWTWRPINSDAARAVQFVPREYLMLDEKKLNAFARMHGASAKLPGIEFYDAGKVTVRG